MDGTWTEKADDVLVIMTRLRESVTEKKTIVEPEINQELYQAVWSLCQQIKGLEDDGGQFFPGSSIMGPEI